MGINSKNRATKARPPVAVLILYVIGIIGLIAGLALATYVFDGSGSHRTYDLTRLTGFFGATIKSTAVVITIFSVVGFMLIDQIRRMKKWALISFTAVFVAALLKALESFFYFRAVQLYNPGIIESFIGYMVVAPPLLYIWLKNRADFK